MILLDAYALTALLADEPAADEVGLLLAGGDTGVAAANLAEAADRLARIHKISVSRTHVAVESLEQSTNLRVSPIQAAHAWWAAELRVKHYHRTRRPLSLGDCLLLAMTGEGDQLATADPDLLATAEEEKIGWIALPDRRAQRHAPKPHD
ncbi:MAG: PIN domain-containing protein [Solirubrobacteraceae bacterium]